MNIQQTLKKIGLSDKEIKIYLTLQKNGPTRPTLLAKMTQLNRATVYSTAQSLIAKGVIAQDVSGKSIVFNPLPPQELFSIISSGKRELNEKENLIGKAVNDLNLVARSKQYPVPKVRIIEEQNIERFLFDNLAKWQTAIKVSDGVWWGYQDHTFVKAFEKWIEYTWSVNRNHYDGKVFSNESDIEKYIQKRYKGELRHIRYLGGTNFTATTWVCGSFLIMIMTGHQPYYLIEIHDELLAKNTREIFKKLWELTNHL